ncbi:hypothetical protein Q5H92_18945 [Hymenobacter sp. M29]|uniref:Lipoprotein n=1 Tax=Hymenobacter mellowenesis TaxID=3063995 RepID=A0ABT9AHM4_9BACT|nr:hypothetical protein [Hymenobacter sp. M29]MDO7848451.1 hypothetical protein [Hymenobacter sp. M29]
MFSKRLFFALAVVGSGALSGCANENDSVPPELTCFSGVVLGDQCWDGVLIQVDSQFPIGKAIQLAPAPDSLATTNVIAATNSADFGSLLNRRGQRVYFTYNTDPNHQATVRVCTTYRAPLSVPHLVVANLSGVPCGVLNR